MGEWVGSLKNDESLLSSIQTVIVSTRLAKSRSQMLTAPEEGDNTKKVTICYYITYARMFFFKWVIPGLFFFIFLFWIQLTEYIGNMMTGFEPLTSDVGSNHSTN